MSNLCTAKKISGPRPSRTNDRQTSLARNIIDEEEFSAIAVRRAIAREISETVKLCHNCGEAWVSDQRFPGRTETCAECGGDLSCCLNCKLYDSRAPNQCQTPTTERVLDKDRANFCDEFEFAEDRAPERPDESGEKTGDAWEKLFGD